MTFVMFLLLAVATTTAPAERRAFFVETFDDGDLAKRGWYDCDRFRILDGCVEYEWKEHDTRPSSSSVARRLFEPTDEIYVRFRLRLSKGWRWTGKGYHPHLINILTTESDRFAGPAKTHLTLYIEPVDGKLRLAAQDIANADKPHGLTQGPLRGGYNGTFYDSAAELFVDDQWHTIEAQFKLNTLDMKNDRPNRDGVVRGWFDGKLVVDRNDVVLRSKDFPDMKLNQLLIAPYFGPGLLPRAQKLWIDEMVVAAQRVEDDLPR